MLEGPEKIEISDEQLEALCTTYADLDDEIRLLISDFFTPLEMLQNEGFFKGKTAENFSAFCMYSRTYLSSKLEISLEQLKTASEEFKSKVEEVESIE